MSFKKNYVLTFIVFMFSLHSSFSCGKLTDCPVPEKVRSLPALVKAKYLPVWVKGAARKAQEMNAEYTVWQDKEGLRIMTFNVRYRTSEENKDHNWHARLPRILRMIHDHQPDVIGMQEPFKSQMKDIKSGLARMGDSYNFCGKKRSRSLFKRDEYNPIFYNTKTVKFRGGDTFGLHESLKRGDAIDNKLPRIVTYGFFETIDESFKFALFNTHLEHQNHPVRKQQVDALMTIIEREITQKVNYRHDIFLIGDFNLPPENPLLKEITDHEYDFINTTNNLLNLGTFHNWGNTNRIIDYIFYAGNAPFTNYAVLQLLEDDDEVFPSDHRPVVLDIDYKDEI